MNGFLVPISVVDALPEDDALCVLYVCGGDYYQLRWRSLGYYSGHKWYSFGEPLEDTDYVTHWLPVPDFPVDE